MTDTARKVGEELKTRSGITAAEPGYYPATGEVDAYDVGTEPLLDSATTKAVLSEAATLRKAGSRDKG